MKKIAISRYGTFELSRKAMLGIAKRKGIVVYPVCDIYGDCIYWTVPKDQQMAFPQADDELERNLYFKFKKENTWYPCLDRDDKDLIAVIEKLGLTESGVACNRLEIVKIPNNVDWIIRSYSWKEEFIVEKHRVWTYCSEIGKMKERIICR